MLTGKQKRYLRSLAHNIDPIFQIGKGGINENMIKQIDDTFKRRITYAYWQTKKILKKFSTQY